MPWIAVGVVLQGVYLLTSIGLNITKRTEFYPMATGLAAATSVGANLALVPRYGVDRRGHRQRALVRGAGGVSAALAQSRLPCGLRVGPDGAAGARPDWSATPPRSCSCPSAGPPCPRWLARVVVAGVDLRRPARADGISDRARAPASRRALGDGPQAARPGARGRRRWKPRCRRPPNWPATSCRRRPARSIEAPDEPAGAPAASMTGDRRD